MVAWGFGFRMWRETLARGVLYLLSAEYSEVMCGAWPETLVPDSGFASVWYTVVLWDFGLRYALRVGGAGSRFRSPCLVVSGQDASGPLDGCGYGAFRQLKFECGCCEMLFFRVCGMRHNFMCQSLSQPWPRWPDFWLFTSINGCRAGCGCPCLFPVSGWFEWPSSGVVGFYDHEPSWSCGLWLRNSLWLPSVGCRLNAGLLLASSRRPIFGGPVLPLGLILKSLYASRWELTYSEVKRQFSDRYGMFLWTFSPLISGGALLSLRCFAL